MTSGSIATFYIGGIDLFADWRCSQDTIDYFGVPEDDFSRNLDHAILFVLFHYLHIAKFRGWNKARLW